MAGGHMTRGHKMSFKTFETDDSNDEQSLPWTQDYVEHNPSCVNTTHDVKAIKLSDKGMMVTTNVARGFVYKSNTTYNHVVEYVKAWSGTKKKSPILQIKLTNIRPYMVLGIDDERHGYWSTEANSRWTQAYATNSDIPQTPVNPFPMPTSPSDSVPTDDSADAPVQSANALPMQTSKEMPLEEAGRPSNGTKGRNTHRSK